MASRRRLRVQGSRNVREWMNMGSRVPVPSTSG